MAPIIIKDFDWNETETSLKVNVKLANGGGMVTKSNLDIFTSNSYIKIHSPPFFWELFLIGEIVPESCLVTVRDGRSVMLTLAKQKPEIWNGIAENITDKSVKQRKRQEAVDAQHRNYNEHKTNTIETRQQQKADLIRQRMKLEEAERREVERMKQANKAKALEAMSAIGGSKSEALKGHGSIGAGKAIYHDVPAPRARSNIFVEFTVRNESISNNL